MQNTFFVTRNIKKLPIERNMLSGKFISKTVCDIAYNEGCECQVFWVTNYNEIYAAIRNGGYIRISYN